MCSQLFLHLNDQSRGLQVAFSINQKLILLWKLGSSARDWSLLGANKIQSWNYMYLLETCSAVVAPRAQEWEGHQNACQAEWWLLCCVTEEQEHTFVTQLVV